MLFVPLLLLGIILYMIGHRVSSVLIFFFFALEGFQIVPEFLFNLHIGIHKGIDFALFYTFILFVYGLIRYDDFIPINPLSKIIFGYIILLCICHVVSIFYYGIPLMETIQTSRSLFLILCYFVIRRLDQVQFLKVAYALLYITLALCFLYALQALIGIPILNGAFSGGRMGILHRFYNYPKFLYLFCFFTIFMPFITVKQKYWMIPVLVITTFLPLSRSAILVFIFLIFLGIFMKIKWTKKMIKYLPVLLIVIAATGAIIMKQIQGRTLEDIQSVLNGDFMEIVESDDDPNSQIEDGATMIFRLALFFERFVDIIESNVSIVIGKGLSADNTAYTNANFKYLIGLESSTGDKKSQGYIAQLYSPDISWSNLILRYGIVGTIVYVFGFIYLAFRILKQKHVFSVPLFLYMVLLIFNSFTSACLYLIVSILPILFFFDTIYYNRKIHLPTEKYTEPLK